MSPWRQTHRKGRKVQSLVRSHFIRTLLCSSHRLFLKFGRMLPKTSRRKRTPVLEWAHTHSRLSWKNFLFLLAVFCSLILRAHCSHSDSGACSSKGSSLTRCPSLWRTCQESGQSSCGAPTFARIYVLLYLSFGWIVQNSRSFSGFSRFRVAGCPQGILQKFCLICPQILNSAFL